MAYRDSRYGSTVIRTERFDNLSISWDYRDNEKDLTQRSVVFLHSPDMKEKDKHGCTGHSHIELTQEQAKTLRDWLNEFFKEVNPDAG